MLSLAAQRCSPVRAFHEGIRAGGTTVCFQLLLLLPRTQHGFSGQRSAGRGCCRCSGRDARSPPALIPLRTSITGSQAGLMTVTEWNCILMSDNLCRFSPLKYPQTHSLTPTLIAAPRGKLAGLAAVLESPIALVKGKIKDFNSFPLLLLFFNLLFFLLGVRREPGSF